jgi:primosomal protein N''
MPKNWSSHEARAHREIERATWERENSTSVPKKKPRAHRTISTTSQKTWKKRIERTNERWARKSGPVIKKQKCLVCDVIYEVSDSTEHSCT